jgi:hypothetical protein
MLTQNSARATPLAGLIDNPTFRVCAFTDIIGGTVGATKYAQEWLVCEPLVDLEPGLVVAAGGWGGLPYLTRMEATGRNRKGWFVPPGSTDEIIAFGPIYTPRNSVGRDVIVYGRLVDQTRAPRDLRQSR